MYHCHGTIEVTEGQLIHLHGEPIKPKTDFIKLSHFLNPKKEVWDSSQPQIRAVFNKKRHVSPKLPLTCRKFTHTNCLSSLQAHTQRGCRGYKLFSGKIISK